MTKVKPTQFLQEGIYVVNRNWQCVSLNDIAVHQFAKEGISLIGKTITEVFPVFGISPLFDILQLCMKDRQPRRFEHHFITTEGPSGWFDLSVQPCREGIRIFSVDINARKETISKMKKTQTHKATEELLEKNEKQFRALIENSTDIMTMVTRSGTIIYASPTITRVLGYTIEELLGTSLLDFIHPEELDEFVRNRDAFMDTAGATYTFQQRRKHKDGRWLWFEGTVMNLLYEPRIMAIVSNLRDVTDKKLWQQQKDFDSNNLHALINNTDDLLWSIDREYRLITSNLPFDRFMERVGIPLEKGSDVLKSADQQKAARFKKSYLRAFAGEHFSIIEHSTAPAELWSEISFCPIRKGNEIIGAACHSRNITKRIKGEQSLRKSETYTRGILDSLSSHIAVIDSKGTIVTVNDSWKQFAIENGDTSLKKTCEGRNYFATCQDAIAMGDEDAINVLPKMKEVLEGTLDTFYYEYPCHSEDQERWFSMRARRFEGEEMLVVVSHQDISERKRTENELIINNLSLQKTTNELDRFVYSVSHDLRSPLTSILGLVNLIEAESKEPDTLLHSTMIRKSINRLDSFIKNILNYSRNERTDIEVMHIPVKETIDEIIALLCSPKDCEEIEFEVDVTEDIPFYSDSHRFITIIENLISNAIKYHRKQKGERFIKIEAKSGTDVLEVSVEDNGTGVSQKNQARIFDMFFRISHTINGSGIGLYIVKESIQKLGGKISVDSTEGEGTCFRIQLENRKP